MTLEEAKELLNNELLNTYSEKKAIAIDVVLRDLTSKDTEINKLNNIIDRTTKYIEEITGSCPYDTFDCQVRDCNNECKDQMAECWKEYFMKE